MNHILHLLPFSVIMLSLVACGTSAPPTPTSVSLFASVAAPSASAPTQGIATVPGPTLPPTPSTPVFNVVVIVDTTSEHVTREQAGAVLKEASGYLRAFSPLGLEMIDFAEDSNGGSTADMAGRYITARSAPLPNGLVIFSFGDNGQAKASGGYGYSLPVLGGFKNAFVSPSGGASQIYVAVVDYGFKYMACGYGESDQIQSSAALAGECRGSTGTACVSQNGYSMCSNAVGNLYMSTPTHFVSSMIVHGLLHNFGPEGDKDHYATPECNARMGYPAAFFDLQESEYYNGLCPFVYEDFTKSYQP
jgi:hypothetical protein